MSGDRSRPLWNAARVLAVVLILKVTASIVIGYGSYLPPDFRSDFLHGRQDYFWQGYHVAFYIHIFSGPIALLSGVLLMSNRLRARFPARHRLLGRTQVANLLLLVVPSGLWMSVYSQTGMVAAVGFACLAMATGVCAYQGWRSAVARNFETHRIWMTRCFLLLCSAVVLRLIGGTFTIIGVESPWSYQIAAWLSWIGPLAAFESFRCFEKVLAPID